MAKKQIIKGKRLLLLEEIMGVHSQLVELGEKIHLTREDLERMRVEKKELQERRNALIREAVKKNVPMKQIGERLGLTKVAIHWIKNEGKEEND